MNYYKLRSSLKLASISDWIQSVNAISDHYAYCYETGKKGENPHMHFYFETMVKNGTLRKRFQKTAQFMGNGAHSMLACEQNPIEYLGYMMKEYGELSTVGIDTKIVDEARDYHKRVKAEMKEKKKNRIPVWKQISLLVQESFSESLSYVELVRVVIRYHQEKSLLINVNRLSSYCTTIALHLDPELLPFLCNKINDDNPFNQNIINLKKSCPNIKCHTIEKDTVVDTVERCVDLVNPMAVDTFQPLPKLFPLPMESKSSLILKPKY